MCSTNTHRSTGKFNGERDGPGKQTKRPFGQSRKDFMCREYPNDGKFVVSRASQMFQIIE